MTQAITAATTKFEIQSGSSDVDPSDCFDKGSPFDTQHIGKLVITGPENIGPPPRNHCLVTRKGERGLQVLRFTHLDGNDLTSLGNVTASADLAAEFHERHLNKLGSFGLYPWFTDIQPGTPAIGNCPGIFIMQRLLPDHASIGLSTFNDRDLMTRRLSQYLSWVSTNNEPAYLYDLDGAEQFSRIGSEIVLHDVEPLYMTRGM